MPCQCRGYPVSDRQRQLGARLAYHRETWFSPVIGRENSREHWRVRSLLRTISHAHGWSWKPGVGMKTLIIPGSWNVLDLPAERPDILHCHNLHGGYFDLRALPWLSQQVPTILTLHDAWLLSGHCAHSLDCERWENRLWLSVQDLTIQPGHQARCHSLQLATKKERFLPDSRLLVATPSQWLMSQSGAVHPGFCHPGSASHSQRRGFGRLSF